MTADILYGSDMYLDKDGDIKLTPQDDFKVISSRDNLKQAVISKLRTILTELTLHSNYGSEIAKMLGEKSIRSNLAALRQTVRKALLQEPRIKENGIKTIRVYYPSPIDKTRIEIDIKIVPIETQIELNILYGVTV